MFEDKNSTISLFLRLGLAFSFLYAGIAAFFNPLAWVGYIPVFLRDMISEGILLNLHSAFNVLLGLWLLSNKKTFYAAVVSAIALFAIIISNIVLFDIVFRDVSILLAAVALAILSYTKE